MPLPQSLYLGRSRYVVAIVGATGDLGSIVAETFLSPPYRPFFSRVVCLTRDISSATAQRTTSLGAEVHEVDIGGDEGQRDSLKKALTEVDIVISALPGKCPVSVRDELFDVALEAGVRVYFPSEFGIDHRLNDFANWDHPLWISKRAHAERCREKAGDRMNVVSVYCGLFLEDSIGPWFGFDTASHLYTSVGPSSTYFTLTSKADVAKSLAVLSLLSMNSFSGATSGNRAGVPSEVRIAGDIVNFDLVRSIILEAQGQVREEANLATHSPLRERADSGFRERVGSGRSSEGGGDNLTRFRERARSIRDEANSAVRSRSHSPNAFISPGPRTINGSHDTNSPRPRTLSSTSPRPRTLSITTAPGHTEIMMREVDVGVFRDEVRDASTSANSAGFTEGKRESHVFGGGGVAPYIRLLIGEGKLDWRLPPTSPISNRETLASALLADDDSPLLHHHHDLVSFPSGSDEQDHHLHSTDVTSERRFFGSGDHDPASSTRAAGNDNEVVNPRESGWRWRTLREYAVEVGGRPWCNHID
ncbi:hypothetical protein JAAARDRAFT_40622 [Jaapia argillacea MUCL 33604]|uniref:NmrA-like domain-containing protein n=1 Tax=Jaapia argillacea MUCL 33604 TaxID=933084 RepID=A0A067PB99_9AGAM|nr:hypothetical protein JAAARDRAFT_40622 [Jaapia argillacea MUCL 33604]